MVKRLFDIIFSLIGLLSFLPVMIIAGICIKITSPGPVFYRAKRVGLNGKTFIMHKLRTMHVNTEGENSKITKVNDLRVFKFGSLLRKLKLDEIPQLYDVLRGEMSLIGPRPEDPEMVKYYTSEHMLTLKVRPGLASPGSIFNYTHGETYLHEEDTENSYLSGLLPLKLELDLQYISKSSFLYDLKILFRTIWVILCMLAGRKEFDYPPEYKKIHGQNKS